MKLARPNPKQLQMVMLYPRPDEVVERAIELPRPDKEEVERQSLQLEIEQLVQAKRELDGQVEKLVNKKMGLEAAERAARKRLRAIFTEPLNLD
jgi:cell division protein FtsB